MKKKSGGAFLKIFSRKRTPLFLCTLFLCIFLPAILLCSHCFDRALFHKITSAYVQSSLEHDALSLHFVMAYPNLQGIHLKTLRFRFILRKLPRLLPPPGRNFYPCSPFSIRKKLNEEERYTYDLLCDRLALDLEESDFSYYEEPLPPTSGMQSELLLLFAEYPFYTADDVKPIFPSCSPFPITCRVCFLMNPKKVQPGFLWKKEDAKKCTAVPRNPHKEALSSGTHFLQTTFSSRLASLLQKDF